MVTKAGYQGWWLWLATSVTKELTMVTDSVARTFFLKIPKELQNIYFVENLLDGVDFSYT